MSASVRALFHTLTLFSFQEADYGIKLPAWPVNKTCDAVIQAGSNSLLKGLAAGMRNYWACCGQQRTCVDPNVDQPDFAASPGWGYIYCTEVPSLASDRSNDFSFWFLSSRIFPWRNGESGGRTRS